ncbi:SUF system Fe-S cluster assembly regulator [Pontiellaceae bacterium B12227]|nr:SUF system Fe-S cluster assembly regulator [Pontiellaceae bacterium B12227]
MLKLTKIEDYAFQILNCIANSDPSTPRTAKELADEVSLPLPTVSKILKFLTQGNILISYQGSKGGYMLARPAHKISIADVMAAFDGPQALTDCCTEAGCPRNCSVSPSWKKLNIEIENLLKTLTLADLSHP